MVVDSIPDRDKQINETYGDRKKSHGFNFNIRIAIQDVQYGGIPLPHTFKIN